jgi:hypothetical protein
MAQHLMSLSALSFYNPAIPAQPLRIVFSARFDFTTVKTILIM